MDLDAKARTLANRGRDAPADPRPRDASLALGALFRRSSFASISVAAVIAAALGIMLIRRARSG